MTKILITGSSGFIGQFLTPQLIAQGHDISCFEEYNYKSIGKLEKFKNVELVNIIDTFAVRNKLEKIKPEIIIHLAAMTAVSHSYEHPHETTLINYLGTINMAENARIVCPKLKQFIFPSSAEVYGIAPSLLKEETDILIPNSPYAISKRACEDYLRYMFEAYNFPMTIFRPFNSYGRTDSDHFVVERIISQMLRSDVCMLGDPFPVRDFLYIDDHINAYLCALEKEITIGKTYNLCTGVGISIQQLAGTIKYLLNWNGKIIWETIPRRPLDIMNLIGDNSRLKRELKWNEPKPLLEGLGLTIDKWIKKVNVNNDV